jgi:hypothetical protein
LGDVEVVIDNNRAYVEYAIKDEGDDTVYYSKEYIDDKNLPYDKLSVRRLQLSKEKKLYSIKYSFFFLGDILKIANGKNKFIDSSGKIFKLKKHKFANVVFAKISLLIPIPSGGVIVEAEGIPGRYKALYLPSPTCKYAAFLKEGVRYIFYGFYDKIPDKSMRRKI